MCFHIRSLQFQVLRHPSGIKPTLQLLNCVHFALFDNLQNLIVCFQKPADIAETQREKMVYDFAVLFGRHLALHIIVIEEERVVLLLEQYKLLEKTLLQKAVVLIQILKHLHTLVSHWIFVHGVLSQQLD